MTHDDKELLLQDLSTRLPYGVIIHVNGHDERVDEINPFEGIITCGFQSFSIDECKPYLRSMSSMTDEEEGEYHNLCYEEEREEIEYGEWVTKVYYHNTIESIDWLNAYHFDYRGLIEKGLAIAVTKENNPYKE